MPFATTWRRVGAASILLGLIVLLAWHPWDQRDRSADRTAGMPANPARAADAVPSTERVTGNTDVKRRPGQPAAAREDAAEALCLRERRNQYRAVRDRIDPASSPEDAVTRALLTRLLTLADNRSPAVAREVDEAVRRWPDDIDVAWLRFETCRGAAGCDEQAALRHLLRVDADNAFAWLPSMTAAHHERNAEAFARALHRAAHARVYDSRMGTAFLRLRPAIGTLSLPASCMYSADLREVAVSLGRPLNDALYADIEAHGIELAVAMPGLLGLSGCRERDPPLSESVRRDCRRLLTRFAAGDTLLERGVALPRLIELSADDEERAQWRERYRRLRWLYTFAPELDRIDGFLWRKWAEGEVPVLQEHALQTQRWPPPDGWLPDDARSRELITGEQR